MTRLRAFLLNNRAAALALLLLALAIRALVPPGSMISAEARTISVTICSDASLGSPRRIEIPIDGPAQSSHEKPSHEAGQESCPYTALGMAGLSAADPLLLASAIAFVVALGFGATASLALAPATRLRPPLRAPPVLAI